MSRWLLPHLLMGAALLAGCGASDYLLEQNHGGRGGGGGGGPDQPGAVTNDLVFRRLAPSCEGCHGTSSTIPAFSSLAAFENLIVYNPRLVSPGAPESSELVKLLEGTSSSGRQMPPAPNTRFSDLAARGLTTITMAQIREWITRLQARGTDGGVITAGRDAVTLRRKTAEQALETLADQLGLTANDFFARAGGTPNEPYWRLRNYDNYPARSPDATGIILDAPDFVAAYFISLGGPNILKNRKRNQEPGPIFFQTWIPLTQAWCRLAVEKPNNSIFFHDATIADSIADPGSLQRIRDNIAYLHIHMLGDYATDADVGDLLELFRRYQPADPNSPDPNKISWIAVCAALTQDPLWMLY